MTHPDDSMTVRLAAQLTGPPTGDPLQAAMRSAAIMIGRRVAELKEVGFDTNHPFDLGEQTGSTPFLITSLATSTVYLVICQKRIEDTFQVAAQVYNEGKVNKSFYKMTLVRANNGSIRANPGW